MRTTHSANRAHMLFPAIVIGFLLPSAALFLFPAGTVVSLDRKQIIAAVWQPFPIYIAVAYRLLGGLADNPRSEAPERKPRDNQAFTPLKRAYILSGLLSALSHWMILVPSLLTTDPSYSFMHVFVPYPFHSYLGISTSLPSYRLSIRLLFQNDWLTATVAAYVFFGWMRCELSRRSESAGAKTLGKWVWFMVAWTVIGGPGAAIAWAAIDREEQIASMSPNGPSPVRILSDLISLSGSS